MKGQFVCEETALGAGGGEPNAETEGWTVGAEVPLEEDGENHQS